jgi:serine/threonine protein kinase
MRWRKEGVEFMPADNSFSSANLVPDRPDSTGLTPGAFLHGYQLRERLGAGGFGEVWRAESPEGEILALKVSRRLEADALATLRREVELFRLLRPNADQKERGPVVALKRDLLSDAPPALVMEYMAGGDLRRWMQARLMRPLALAESLSIVRDVLEALEFARVRGVVHRDLSPENILLDLTDYRWKLADFGLGFLQAETELSLVRSGASTELSTRLAGKLRYMAPEVQRGEQATASADLYALGVAWAQLLLGSMEGGLPANWAKRVPPEARPLLERCLEDSPADRWDTAGELLEALPRQRKTFSSSIIASALDGSAITLALEKGKAFFRKVQKQSETLHVETPPSDSRPFLRVEKEIPFLGLQAIISSQGRRAIVWGNKGEDGFYAALWNARLGEQLSPSYGGFAFFSAYLALSPNGQRAARAESLRGIRVFNASTGGDAVHLKGTFFPPKVAAFSPDGKQIAAGYDSGVVSGWDAKTGEALWSRSSTLETNGSVTALAFSPNGRVLLAVFLDGQIRVWDQESGSLLRSLQPSLAAIACATISRDSRRALAGGETLSHFRRDHCLHLLDLETGETLRIFSGPRGAAMSVAFSPDGRRAISGGRDGSVCVWDLESGNLTAVARQHLQPVTAVGFEPDDDRRAFSLGKEPKIIRWTLGAEEPAKAP